MRLLPTVAVSFATLALAPAAFAQQAPPLPPPDGQAQQAPPPPGQPLPPQGQQQPPPGYYQQQQPPPGYSQQQQPPPGYYQQQPYPQQQQPQYYGARPPPPPVEYTPPEQPPHAPKFSLWVGPRLSYMGFGLSFFNNTSGQRETTGNFVGNGIGTQLDIGVRLAHKYIPHIFYERGFLAQGHRYEGTNASSSSDFYGIGFRFGGADDIGFISDISVGKRIIRVSNGSETYEMSGLEIFKLGLGAEFRLSTLFTIEALATVSGGSLTDTSGTATYGPNQGDGRTQPDWRNGGLINDQTSYVQVSLGAGLHFDIFGK